MKKETARQTRESREPKLVRDRIPEIIRADGRKFRSRVADDNEHHDLLLRKLDEEIKELKKTKNKNEKLNELADVLEVIYAIAEHHEIDRKDIENKRKKKAQERGAFKKRIILEEW